MEFTADQPATPATELEVGQRVRRTAQAYPGAPVGTVVRTDTTAAYVEMDDDGEVWAGTELAWTVVPAEPVSDPELDRLLSQVVSPDARLLAALDAATTVDPNGYELEALRDEDGTPSGAWAVRVTIDRPGARRPVAISMVGHPLLDAVIVIVGRARVISSIPAPSSSDLVAVLV